MRDLIRSVRSHTRGRSEGPSEPDAVAELALWASTADGVLDETEVEELSALLARIEGLAGFDADRARTIVSAMAAKYPSEDAIATRILELAAHIHEPELRTRSYQLAIWSCARDGQFSEEEAAFLENLQEALELSDDEADALLKATIETAE
jgi:tellurite resistance protein